MASCSITCPTKCKRISTFSPLSFSATYNFCNISFRRKLTGTVRAHRNFLSSFPYQPSCHRNLYCEKQGGLSLIAFDGKNPESEGEDDQALDAIMKLHSSFKNKKTHELSQDERQRVSNFLSFLEDFQGRTQVLEFFSYLTSIFGNNIQIVVKPTPQHGLSVGLQWKFDWDKIDVPLGKGFSLHINHTYHGKALIRNIEMLMEPLLHLQPFGLKMKVSLKEFMDNIGSFMVSESGNKTKRILYFVIALLSLASFLFFMKLAS
ncbi:hypothetical protein Fmac_009303 [Flemingia macrophylla]|uniref:Transmembrane protein n=1 Tax=Flemingia macrophylla TaxID=520843 RepID=A0ABD1MZY9_9FABA